MATPMPALPPTRAPGAPGTGSHARGQRGPITRAFLDVLQALLWDFQRHEIGRSVLGHAVNRRAEQGVPIVVIVRQV